MTFYVSDVLKDNITEENIIEERQSGVENINYFSEIFSAVITTKNKKINCEIIDLEIKNSSSLLTFGFDTMSDIFENIVRVSLWDNVEIKIKNNTVVEINQPEVSIKKIQKSLTGYNYTVTIIINKIISF